MRKKFRLVVNKNFPKNMFINPGIWSPEQQAWCYRSVTVPKLRPDYLWVVPRTCKDKNNVIK